MFLNQCVDRISQPPTHQNCRQSETENGLGGWLLVDTPPLVDGKRPCRPAITPTPPVRFRGFDLSAQQPVDKNQSRA